MLEANPLGDALLYELRILHGRYRISHDAQTVDGGVELLAGARDGDIVVKP